MSTVPESKNRRVLLVLLAMVGAWALFLCLYPFPKDGGALVRPRLEPTTPMARADYSWTLEGLDGKPIDFGAYKGRAVFLNLWATWCPPCRAELPSIANLAANPRLKRVAFACVSTDQDPEELRQFVKDKGLTLPVFRAASVPPAFQTEAIPATFLIAPDGAIVAGQLGSAQWDEPAVVDLLEKLSTQGR